MEPNETLCEQLPSQNLRKTREPDMVQQNLLWKIFRREDIVKRHISKKIFTQMLCGQQVLPSTYRDLHSHRLCLPWEETINRDAKHSTKNPNLSIGSVRLCVFCQRKVLAQCRGRCCRQHLLGGLPISATIQPFNVCKDLAQEQFLSA